MSLANSTPDGTFVKAVADLVQPVPQINRIYDKTILTLGQQTLEFDNPALSEPTPLKCSTLQAIVDLYTRLTSESIAKVIVHVESPTCVRLVDPFQGIKRQNLVYGVAEPVAIKSHFGNYLRPEEFLIWLMSGFVESPVRLAVQKATGNFRSGLAADIEDDGVTQNVTTKRGLTRTEDTPITNPVMLAPYCTFPEIKQPERAFVLRTQQVQNGQADMGATVALFEADGGAWRAQAIGSIGKWLREQLGEDVTIIA